jgi:large subunit ribosomal protein L6
MSNVGKTMAVVPSHLNLRVRGWKLYASGPFGERCIVMPPYTKIDKRPSLIGLIPKGLESRLYGSLQRKLDAFIYGMSYIYVKRLLFVGVGYRARLAKKDNKTIILRLGYSHEISVKIPENISLRIVKRNNIILNSNDFEGVSQFAYALRSYRKPEPFKGKGVVIKGEEVRRKEGKKKKV